MCCSSNKGGGLKTLMLGMLVGLVLGVIFAPKPGGEMLSGVSEKVMSKLPV
ncbi:MAG: hypothetical protein ACYC5A_03095 [Thermoleophilia bacterium]